MDGPSGQSSSTLREHSLQSLPQGLLGPYPGVLERRFGCGCSSTSKAGKGPAAEQTKKEAILLASMLKSC